MDLADALAGKSISAEGQVRPVTFAELSAIRKRLTEAPGSDFYSRWGAWLFQDRLASNAPPFKP